MKGVEPVFTIRWLQLMCVCVCALCLMVECHARGSPLPDLHSVLSLIPSVRASIAPISPHSFGFLVIMSAINTNIMEEEGIPSNLQRYYNTRTGHEAELEASSTTVLCAYR